MNKLKEIKDRHLRSGFKLPTDAMFWQSDLGKHLHPDDLDFFRHAYQDMEYLFRLIEGLRWGNQ